MNKITRKIKTRSRLLEIVNSMPNPIIKCHTFNLDGKSGGVPSISVEASNKDGVCIYIYRASGLIDVSSLILSLQGKGTKFD